MKFLADECIHSDLVKFLKENTFDVITVEEAGLNGKTDDEVFKKTVKLKRVLLTFDRGFGDVFRYKILTSYGIIILLISKMDKDEINSILLSFLSNIDQSKIKGKLVIIGRSKIRTIERNIR